jgi:hypothetical protein
MSTKNLWLLCHSWSPSGGRFLPSWNLHKLLENSVFSILKDSLVSYRAVISSETCAGGPNAEFLASRVILFGDSFPSDSDCVSQESGLGLTVSTSFGGGHGIEEELQSYSRKNIIWKNTIAFDIEIKLSYSTCTTIRRKILLLSIKSWNIDLGRYLSLYYVSVHVRAMKIQFYSRKLNNYDVKHGRARPTWHQIKQWD